ncbi:hypothetical protein KLMIMMO121B_01255 [Klebsiella michiganensis]
MIVFWSKSAEKQLAAIDSRYQERIKKSYAPWMIKMRRLRTLKNSSSRDPKIIIDCVSVIIESSSHSLRGYLKAAMS